MHGRPIHSRRIVCIKPTIYVMLRAKSPSYKVEKPISLSHGRVLGVSTIGSSVQNKSISNAILISWMRVKKSIYGYRRIPNKRRPAREYFNSQNAITLLELYRIGSAISYCVSVFSFCWVFISGLVYINLNLPSASRNTKKIVDEQSPYTHNKTKLLTVLAWAAIWSYRDI